MKFYNKLFFSVVILMLLGLGVFAQKKITPKKKAVSPSVKATAPKLTPPLTRKFNHSFELTSDYDKFENSTKVQLRIPGSESGAAYFLFFFAGEKLKTFPKDILFQYFENPDNFLLPVKDFIVLADENRLRLKLTELPSLGEKKHFFTKIDYQTFLRIAKSDSVEMKIGETEITFTTEALEALKDFASRTNPANYKNAQTSQNKEERQLRQGVIDIISMSPNNKAKVVEILGLIEQAIAISKKSSDAREILSACLEPFKLYSEINQNLPNTILKQRIENATGDLAASAIMRGIKAKVIESKDASGFKPLLDIAIKENNLTNVPENERASILLSFAEEGYNDAYKIAVAAGIIEDE